MKLSEVHDPPASDDLDVFADVSHHGSTLFELLALPQHLDNLSAPLAHPPLHDGITNALHHSQTALHQHARAESTVLHSTNGPAVSINSPSPTGSPAAPMPPMAFPPFQPPQVDSYCTVDPDVGLNTPVLPVDFDQNLVRYDRSPQVQPPSVQSPPPPRPARKGKKNTAAAATSRSDDPKEQPRMQRKLSAAKNGLPPARAISKRATPTPAAANIGSTATRRKARSPQTSTPARESPNDTPDSENSDHSDDYAKNRSPNCNSLRTSAAGDNTSMIDDVVNKDTHNSHTRRCRAKVNSKFQELLSILPTPPPKTGIKHKAQILDYTIRVFKDIHARKTLLEAELALSSRAQLNAWVDNVVSRSTTLQHVLAPYLSLVCTKGSWKYSEAWIPSPETAPNGSPNAKVEAISGDNSLTPATLASSANSKLRLGLAIIPQLGNSDDPDLPNKLERFRDRSRSYACKPRVDLPGRIMCTMRPEWLPSLDDSEAFQRSRHTHEASLRMCFGVPLFVRGHVAAVAVFFDTEQRSYDAKCVDLADNIAALLGNAFGASTLKD